VDEGVSPHNRHELVVLVERWRKFVNLCPECKIDV
jgi:hypothetical protein